MRVMVKFALPVDAGSSALRTGKLDEVSQQLVDELKPEAAYFFPEGGERASLFVLDIQDSSQVAETAERFFFGVNAQVEIVPVMNAEDLQKALSGVQSIIQRYG
jgi:hypothetical protein